MARRVLAASVLLCGALLAGCPSESPTVTLIVFTDFEVGEQFSRARYTFVPEAGGPTTLSGELPASAFAPTMPLPRATTGRLAFDPTPQLYRVELIGDDGNVVASVSEHSSFAGRDHHEIAITITRGDCEGVGPCDTSESCLCGGCYPIDCRSDPEGPGCPGRCCGATGCEVPAASCAEAVCLEDSHCAWVPMSSACRAGEWCDARNGCTPRGQELDAGGPDAASLDAGGSPDAAADLDAGEPDAASSDAAIGFDATTGPDAAVGMDAAIALDATVGLDAGRDAGNDAGAGRMSDAAVRDAGRDAALDGGLCGGAHCSVGTECCAGTCGPIGCDDGNECTFDSCGPTGCRHTARAGACTDDGNACTNDLCASGACTHPSRTGSCDDGSMCTVGDVCTGASCIGTTVSCNDFDPCTMDRCDAMVGCVHTPVMSGSCDDGDACTVGDHCLAGTCQAGTPMNCSDSNPCTVDSCSAGSCSHGASCATFPTGSPSYSPAACCDPGAAGGGDQFCVDPNYDESNCGGCGYACGSGEYCAPGTVSGGGTSAPRCRCGTTTGLLQPACRTGAMPACCSDACVDLATDPDHCGLCGRRCSGATPNCVSGACRA